MTRSRSRTRSRSSYPTSEGSSKPVASPDSSTRSAARATYSAYKRQPIRWRLAGGSAALTLVILLGFAVIVGTLTTRAIYKDFNRQVASAADRLQTRLNYQLDRARRQRRPAVRGADRPRRLRRQLQRRDPRRLPPNGRWFDGSDRRAELRHRPTRAATRSTAGGSRRARLRLRAARRPGPYYTIYVQYGRRVSDVQRDGQPREAVPRPRRARRRRARAARRPGHRAPRDGADRRADRRRARDRAHARPVAADAAPGGRRRGRRAGHDAGVDAARARRGARRRPRPRSPASASSSPTPRTSCARR